MSGRSGQASAVGRPRGAGDRPVRQAPGESFQEIDTMSFTTQRTGAALRLGVIAAACLPAWAAAQDFKQFFVPDNPPNFAAHTPCKGRQTQQVQDIAFEGVKTTVWNYAVAGGGGEGGRFDKVPVLSTNVTLRSGCLNAHFSAMVGSQIYGVSNMTLFQVTLTPPGGGPLHMVGHYETPYGVAAPAVASTAEYDVDMLAANFYAPVGTGTGQFPPGNYRVDVWWSGGPTAPGGAIGAAFVLKLYQ